jgi:hypothetical protein
LTSQIQITVEILCEIYTRPGTHVGFENNCSSWTRISTVTMVSRGQGKPTPLPAKSFDPVSIGQFSVQAFYITLRTSDGKGRCCDTPKALEEVLSLRQTTVLQCWRGFSWKRIRMWPDLPG